MAYLDGLQAKVDALKALQAQTQAELDALLPSVLDKAFKGELLYGSTRVSIHTGRHVGLPRRVSFPKGGHVGLP